MRSFSRQNHHPNDPATGGVFRSYVPYFYESGLYLWQAVVGSQRPRTDTTAPYGRYDFSTDRPSSPLPVRGQTVEQIIAHGYLAVPDSEPEMALISDRQQTSWLGLEDTIAQIRNRYRLYNTNCYELDLAVCEANNAVHRQEAAQGAPANERQRYSAQKAIQAIYEQKRAERVTLWRDVSRLRQVLPETAQQYLAAYRKLSILYDTPGEGP